MNDKKIAFELINNALKDPNYKRKGELLVINGIVDAYVMTLSICDKLNYTMVNDGVKLCEAYLKDHPNIKYSGINIS